MISIIPNYFFSHGHRRRKKEQDRDLFVVCRLLGYFHSSTFQYRLLDDFLYTALFNFVMLNLTHLFQCVVYNSIKSKRAENSNVSPSVHIYMDLYIYSMSHYSPEEGEKVKELAFSSDNIG